MKAIDLDGKESNIRLDNHIVKLDNNRCKSALHLRARNIIHEIYPNLPIAEEVPIKVKFGLTLYLDFYIHQVKRSVEVNGSQHYSFNPMFHKSRAAFLKQRKNDNYKREWCEINNIELIELKYDEADEWKTLILG